MKNRKKITAAQILFARLLTSNRRVEVTFHDAQRRTAEYWENLVPEHLAKPLGRALPDGSDTLGGAIRFLVWHEAYHLGQLGMLRRLAGKLRTRLSRMLP